MRFWPGLILILANAAIGQNIEKSAGPPRKVLVELYTSQGCNSCPSANLLLGQLEKLGYGPDQIIPISFHVDYFNEPWVDPFSHKDYSHREAAYSAVLKRNDLYFTPMMMIDGRKPMLGSNKPEALRTIKTALAEKPGASIQLSLLSEKESDQSVRLDLKTLSTDLHGRSVMVAVVLTEGPLTTRVRSGENAGSTLVEPFVVRSFAFKQVKLEGSEKQSFTFPIKLPTDAVESKCRVAAFVQDWDNGQVYQAESIPLRTTRGTVRR